MDPSQKQVTVSISRLTGYLDGVISNAQKAKDELEAARRARAATPSQDSFIKRVVKAALSHGEKK